MYNDSRILKLTVFWVESKIEKLSALTGTLWLRTCSQCSLIAEWGGAVKGIRLGKMVKMIKFLFFAQKVSSGMGALRPKFLGG